MADERLEAVEIERTVREMGLPKSTQRTTLLGFAAEQERRRKAAERSLRWARLQGFVCASIWWGIVGALVAMFR